MFSCDRDHSIEFIGNWDLLTVWWCTSIHIIVLTSYIFHFKHTHTKRVLVSSAVTLEMARLIRPTGCHVVIPHLRFVLFVLLPMTCLERDHGHCFFFFFFSPWSAWRRRRPQSPVSITWPSHTTHLPPTPPHVVTLALLLDALGFSFTQFIPFLCVFPSSGEEQICGGGKVYLDPSHSTEGDH